jgi:hypothetical protein
MDFLNFDKMHDKIVGIYKDEAGELAEKYADIIDEAATMTVHGILDDMHRYVHLKDTYIPGNFCNIRQDWDVTVGFVPSSVEPWGRFDDIVARIDNGTVSASELERFQTWCQDWFFYAFGERGLRYNFYDDLMSLEEEEQYEAQYEIVD